MSLLLSGENIVPGGMNAPSLYEIGYSLCQVPRFVGHTRVPWSVLQHSYAVACFAKLSDWSQRMQFLCLMHDAHESIIGDIPTGWKTEGMRAFQEELDRRIFDKIAVTLPTAEEAKRVKYADNAVLTAERAAFGHKNGTPQAFAVDAVKFARWAAPEEPDRAGHAFKALAYELLREATWRDQADGAV